MQRAGELSSVLIADAAGGETTHVSSTAGQRREEFGRALRTETSVLTRPIANVLGAKKLKTKEQKRGTRYFVR